MNMYGVKNGCNAFNSATPKSTPLSFWTSQDIMRYLQITKSRTAQYTVILQRKKRSIAVYGVSENRLHRLFVWLPKRRRAKQTATA